MTTISSAILDPLMASDPAGPRITYYDDSTGERIELSTATLVNWAAKTGNLLRDEMGAGPSHRVAVLLPAHWQTAAVLFGIWWIGAEVVTGGAADIALCTAERLGEADDAVGMGEIAVLSLDPFGKPVPDLPVGLTDYATAVRVHGDQIVPERNPGAALDGRSVTDVLSGAQAAAAAQGLTADDRLLSTADWTNADDLTENLLAVFAIGASLVQVANQDAAAMDRRRQTEKITRG
ncbi:TIGR03089 family protein [Mycolicibacterium tusciae]|uniref:TIGR03089 family protein n=1 Tax=Mycolicibacterium tusciae TaxID=75922 RepID=UPI00024A2290|nr:TIGR03089 family protein [Mycolicibacterium tusciae]